MTGRVKIPTECISGQGVDWANSKPHAGVLGSIFVKEFNMDWKPLKDILF
jgi:hypothetical protein